MDEIIAVEVTLQDGQRRYVLTWGRIQAQVDGGPIAEIVLRRCTRFALDGEPVSARVLLDLRGAMDTPQFFESFFDMCQRRIPRGRWSYRRWKKRVAAAQERGEELWYLWYDMPKPQIAYEAEAVRDPDGRVRRIDYPD